MKVLRILSTAVLLLFASSAGWAAEDTPEQIPGTTRVTAEDVVALVGKFDDLVIIDARTKKDNSAGFIEGAISLPDTETTPASLAAHIPTKTTPVLFYCNGVKCGRSVTSCQMALAEGYSNVYWFRGGWGEWTAKGMPVAH
ncbi:MAG: rhodanese-like domain-containing protein [Pseudomonadota bacterium]|nr:MAG: rhodanese-like domain-containing protein [Pseudomonadota bacterium]